MTEDQANSADDSLLVAERRFREICEKFMNKDKNKSPRKKLFPAKNEKKIALRPSMIDRACCKKTVVSSTPMTCTKQKDFSLDGSETVSPITELLDKSQRMKRESIAQPSNGSIITLSSTAENIESPGEDASNKNVSSRKSLNLSQLITKLSNSCKEKQKNEAKTKRKKDKMHSQGVQCDSPVASTSTNVDDDLETANKTVHTTKDGSKATKLSRKLFGHRREEQTQTGRSLNEEPSSSRSSESITSVILKRVEDGKFTENSMKENTVRQSQLWQQFEQHNSGAPWRVPIQLPMFDELPAGLVPGNNSTEEEDPDESFLPKMPKKRKVFVNKKKVPNEPKNNSRKKKNKQFISPGQKSARQLKNKFKTRDNSVKSRSGDFEGDTLISMCEINNTNDDTDTSDDEARLNIKLKKAMRKKQKKPSEWSRKSRSPVKKLFGKENHEGHRMEESTSKERPRRQTKTGKNIKSQKKNVNPNRTNTREKTPSESSDKRERSVQMLRKSSSPVKKPTRKEKQEMQRVEASTSKQSTRLQNKNEKNAELVRTSVSPKRTKPREKIPRDSSASKNGRHIEKENLEASSAGRDETQDEDLMQESSFIGSRCLSQSQEMTHDPIDGAVEERSVFKVPKEIPTKSKTHARQHNSRKIIIHSKYTLQTKNSSEEPDHESPNLSVRKIQSPVREQSRRTSPRKKVTNSKERPQIDLSVDVEDVNTVSNIPTKESTKKSKNSKKSVKNSNRQPQMDLFNDIVEDCQASTSSWSEESSSRKNKSPMGKTSQKQKNIKKQETKVPTSIQKSLRQEVTNIVDGDPENEFSTSMCKNLRSSAREQSLRVSPRRNTVNSPVKSQINDLDDIREDASYVPKVLKESTKTPKQVVKISTAKSPKKRPNNNMMEDEASTKIHRQSTRKEKSPVGKGGQQAGKKISASSMETISTTNEEAKPLRRSGRERRQYYKPTACVVLCTSEKQLKNYTTCSDATNLSMLNVKSLRPGSISSRYSKKNSYMAPIPEVINEQQIEMSDLNTLDSAVEPIVSTSKTRTLRSNTRVQSGRVQKTKNAKKNLRKTLNKVVNSVGPDEVCSALNSLNEEETSKPFKVFTNPRFKSVKGLPGVSVALDNWATGLLKLDPGRSKPQQVAMNHQLSFCVIDGTGEIEGIDKNVTVNKLDTFIIPPGSAYSIRNSNKHDNLVLAFMKSKL